MHSEQFNQVLASQMQATVDVLGSKAGEYATDGDRLHNFKVVAELQGITLREAVVGLMAKHTVSIFDLARSKREVSEAMWDEKITDHINYLVLLKAALVEEAKELSDTTACSLPEYALSN